MEPAVRTPLTIALVDDYDIVVMGVAHILEMYRKRVVIAELDTNQAVSDLVDIVLYDSFAHPESDHDEIRVLIRNPRARRVVVYTWNFHPDLIESARRQGVDGYLSKALPARDLVSALEAIHAGDIVISDPPFRARSIGGLNWPGRSEGLTDRESEILALITQRQEQRRGGNPHLPQPENREVLHPNDLSQDQRCQPHAGGSWGVRHGFTPDHNRIEH
jgi:DNA-binding NarL/FixJ family response regulator